MDFSHSPYISSLRSLGFLSTLLSHTLMALLHNVANPPMYIHVAGETLNNFYNRVHCLERQDEMVWIGLIWLRIGTSGGLL
jgi:hypothetical protein